MALVFVRSFYTSTEGSEEIEVGEKYVVPALEGETPQDTLNRKYLGAQKHGYSVLQYSQDILETLKYFDDWDETEQTWFSKRYYFTIE